MMARGRMRASLLAAGLALAAGLGGCASGGPTLFERIGTLAGATLAGPDAAPAPGLSRAELDRMPSAVIAVTSDAGQRAYLVPLSDNDGYLNYRDAGGNGVVLLGGAVSRTESLGHDLQAVRHHRRDPIAHPTPLAEWPGRVPRDYQYLLRDLGRYRITLDCVFEPVARETIEIVELNFDVARVAEICTNAERQVTSTYWVDEATGFVWKSRQWVGPQTGHLTIEVIRPYSG